MEWWLWLITIVAALLAVLLTGLPAAFGFLIVGLTVLYALGGSNMFVMAVQSSFSMVTNYYLAPILLFILMGEVIFRTGIAYHVINICDRWIGRIPGRLSLLSVGAGTLLGALSGSAIASCSILGSTLTPEMKRQGYNNEMSLGPIMSGALLSVLIPPTGMGVLVACIAQVSVSKLLIGIIMPGLLMSALSMAYILIRAIRNPSLAPPYPVRVSWRDKIAGIPHLFPLSLIIFLVTGVIFLGIATPSEAAATGALGCFILAAGYRRLTWQSLKACTVSTARVGVMILSILMFSGVFSQILAYTGGAGGLAEFAIGVPVPSIVLLAGLLLVTVILGCFMDMTPVAMICIPIFMPIVTAVGFNPVAFTILMLISVVVGNLTPPFGIVLFTMKGMVPKDIPMRDIYTAAFPYLGVSILVMGLVLVFPKIALWLPGLMR